MRGLAFDIETASVDALHNYGPKFIRLCGWRWIENGTPANDISICPDPSALADALRAADFVTAHNGINFDLMAFARWGFISLDEYETICRKSFDTMIVERQLNPVAARGVQPDGYYSLGETSERYGLDGKDTVDFSEKVDIIRRVQGDKKADRMIAARAAAARKAERKGVEFNPTDSFSALNVLKDAYGGYDKIPADDPVYIRYLIKDVTAQTDLFLAQHVRVANESTGSKRYIRREHYTASAMGRVTLEGAHVNEDFVLREWSAGQRRLDEGKKLLHEKYGMPLEGAKPHVTNAGKAAFRRAILASGISEPALNANWPANKDGSLATGKDVLNGFIPLFEKRNPQAAEICKVILAMNGERSVYGTILDHMVGGKVHPYIGPDQSSGRWSMRNPGLTVLGKRGGKARERNSIIADPGDLFVAIDADQVDARVIAAECQDPEYMRLFAPGMDLHSEVAFRVWPDASQHGPTCHRDGGHDCGFAAKCHCVRRDQAKVFGHGFSYGLGAKSMAVQHGVDRAVADAFVEGMTLAFPRLAEWKSEVRAAAGALGYGEEPPAGDTYRVLHTWAGRPVRVERARAYTQATALLGQGGTRDVMAQALLGLPDEYRRRVRAVIHDEFLISLPNDRAEERAQHIADSMSFDLKGVQITFGVSRLSRTWGGCYGEEYEQAA